MTLIQLATIKAGYPFRGKIPEASQSSAIVIQMKDVSPDTGIRWASCIATELTGKHGTEHLAIGDILVAARGNHNYAVLINSSLTSTGKHAVAAPHFFVVRIHKSQHILPEFMTWLLNQTPTQRYFEQNAEGTLTKSIRRNVLENTPVIIPPLKKQQAIIAMANALHQEQTLIQTLLDNGKRIMDGIAYDLYQADHC